MQLFSIKYKNILLRTFFAPFLHGFKSIVSQCGLSVTQSSIKTSINNFKCLFLKDVHQTYTYALVTTWHFLSCILQKCVKRNFLLYGVYVGGCGRVFMKVHAHVQSLMSMCKGSGVRDRSQHHVSFLRHLPPWYLRQSLSLVPGTHPLACAGWPVHSRL